MKIINKFLWKNIMEKKFRTLLIVFSITISAALFFCSCAITDTLGSMCEDKLKQSYGSAQILVQPDSNSKEQFFDKEDAFIVKEKTEYIHGLIKGYAGFKYKDEPTTSVALIGIGQKELDDIYDLQFEEEKDAKSLSGEQIIISSKFAKAHDYKLNDKITLKFNGEEKNFEIRGIAKQVGPFMDESLISYFIMPKDTLAKMYYQDDKVNCLYLKVKEGEKVSDIIDELTPVYKDFEVRETITQEEIDTQVGTMVNSMVMLTAIVFLLSVFIIYSSFQVLVLERLPIIGILRSVGCTKGNTNCLLLLETIIYGVLGGVFGNLAGIGILYAMADMSNNGVQKTTIEYTTVQIIGTFIISILLSIVSSIIPIKKVSKIPVKDVILNMFEKPVKKKGLKTILGCVFVILAIVFPRIANKDNALYLDLLSMILAVAAVIILVPMITNIFVAVLGKLYQLIFGNVGTVSAKNIRNNSSMYNSIALLSIGISCVLMINIVSNSVGEEVLNVFHVCKYDVMLKYSQADDDFLDEIKSLDGVDEINPVYVKSDVQLSGAERKIGTVQGVDINTFDKYLQFKYEGKGRDKFDEFADGRKIYVTTIVRDRLDLKVGDSLKLVFDDKEYSYEVLGFFNTLMFDGDYALISAENMKNDAGADTYGNIYIKTDKEPDDVVDTIKEEYSQESFWISTVQEMIDAQIESNDELFVILNGFSILALLIGILGVVNNLIINFIERKKSFAIYRSIGMSKAQLVKMVFIESFTGGIIGSVLGILASVLLLYGVYYALIAMEMPMSYYYSTSTFVVTLLGGVLVTLFASISPMMKSSKLNIIESIKYE